MQSINWKLVSMLVLLIKELFYRMPCISSPQVGSLEENPVGNLISNGISRE